MSAETEAPKAAVNVDDTLSFDDAVATDFTVKLDGKDLKITEYEDCYVLNPTNTAMIPNEDGIDQKVSIYVPENATKDSAIIFAVNNSGWIVNAYNARTQIMPDMEYASDRDTAFALQAVLFRALENNDSVVDPNCAFAWIQPHAGDYDVQEAYAWLDGVLK